GDEDRLAPHAVRQGTGCEVGGRLHQSEGEDVGERRGEGVEMEHPGPDQRQHRALLADHPTNEGVHPHQKRELGQVGAKAEAHRPRRPRHGRVARRRPEATAQSSGPPMATARSSRPVAARMLAAVIARSPWPHITVSGPAFEMAVADREPSSTWMAPGRCPAAYSAPWRTSRTALVTPEAGTSGTRTTGSPEASHASMPPASSPVRGP